MMRASREADNETDSECAQRGFLTHGSLPLEEARGALVLEADFIQQLGVRNQPLIQGDRPRAGVGLRIVYGDLDFQGAVVRAPDALRDVRGTGQGAADEVQPEIVAEAGALHYQRVPLPMTYGVAVPGRLRIAGQRASVEQDLPIAGVELVQQDD